jgi:hypothetical protein
MFNAIHLVEATNQCAVEWMSTIPHAHGTAVTYISIISTQRCVSVTVNALEF